MTFDIIDYTELLSRLKWARPNHLLLGNGFNNSLGVRTNYSEVFLRMKKELSGYRKVEERIKDNGYDVEFLIEELKSTIHGDDSSFLADYVEGKVKLDFMKAINEIVQESVKTVYKVSNEGIYSLLMNFDNYFTLNFDPLLYLILMKLKKERGDGDVEGLQPEFEFQGQYSKDLQLTILNKIREAREDGELGVTIGGKNTSQRLRRTKKGTFTDIVKDHFRDEDWPTKYVENACDYILKAERKKRLGNNLRVDDGFQREKLVHESTDQNVYFPHGALHIIKNGNKTEKIERTQNKAFLRVLEEVVNSENKRVLCVLKGTTEDKVKEIKQHSYLKKCLNKLSKIDGTLVILGCSMSDNDKHIFDCINQSNVKDIYISSSRKNAETSYQKSLKLFPDKDKSITLFDRDTIQYGPNINL